METGRNVQGIQARKCDLGAPEVAPGVINRRRPQYCDSDEPCHGAPHLAKRDLTQSQFQTLSAQGSQVTVAMMTVATPLKQHHIILNYHKATDEASECNKSAPL